MEFNLLTLDVNIIVFNSASIYKHLLFNIYTTFSNLVLTFLKLVASTNFKLLASISEYLTTLWFKILPSTTILTQLSWERNKATMQPRSSTDIEQPTAERTESTERTYDRLPVQTQGQIPIQYIIIIC